MLLLVIALADDAAKPAPDEAQERQRQEGVAQLASAEAARLELFVGEDRSPAALHKEPLLRWSNPTAGSVHGEVFLWMYNERPAAIASIYRWYHPFKDSTVEFVSVAEQGLAAAEDGKSQWNTKSPGVRFAPLPKAPRPADGRGARLVQMRALARRFNAELADKRGGDSVARELRLLNQPAHRYESSQHKIVDGGLFAFVEGTDPEAWLILEAIEGEDGTAWRYALVRMNLDALSIRLDDRVIHEWPNLRDAWTDRTKPYVMFNFNPERLTVEQPASKEPPRQE